MSEIKLYQGDCLELMKNIPDKSIDLIVTDPPYGMKFQSGYRKVKYKKKLVMNILNGWMSTLMNVSEYWMKIVVSIVFVLGIMWIYLKMQ